MQRVDRPRIAVVGAGYWGPRLVRNLHRAAPDVLAAVCDLDPSKLEALAEDYPNLRTTTSVQSLLEDPAIDAFMLALPPHLHHDIGLAALKAGKHLFVEKPIATDVSRGRDLLNAARRVDRQLMVGLVYCHHPLVERARGLLAAGRLGRPTRVISWRTNLNPRPKHANILWLLAPHDLSIFSRWLGTRPNVVSTAMRRERHPDFEDVADVELVYPENVRATVRLSWLEPDKVRRILVAGDVASLVFDEMHAPPRITLHARGWKDGDPEPAPEPDAWSEYLGEPSELLSLMEPVEPLFLECRHFIECLKTGERPLTGGELALEVTEIIQSIQNAGRDEQRAAAETSDGRLNHDHFYPGVVVGAGAQLSEFIELGYPAADGGERETRLGASARILSHAVIYAGVTAGDRFFCAHHAMIREDCSIGDDVSVGTGCVIEHHVTIEDGVRLHSGAFVPEFSVLRAGCWIGPRACLTNARYPRSPGAKENLQGPEIGAGAIIGANATILAAVHIGERALVGAGAVVTHDVPDGAVVAGNPARVITTIDKLPYAP